MADPKVNDAGYAKSIAERSWATIATRVVREAETLLEAHFGERCPASEPDCPICERYRLLDELVRSPYDDS